MGELVAIRSFRTDEMPCKIGACFNILSRAGSRAKLLVPENRFRKRLTIWTHDLHALGTQPRMVAVLAPTERDANAFNGALLDACRSIMRYDFTPYTELWVRSALSPDTSESGGGVAVPLLPSTEDQLISVLSEQWED
jgi:hypothetical protein